MRVRVCVCVRLALRRRFFGGLVPHAVLTPCVALYFPATQLSHAVLTPAAALNVPAWQSSHAVLMPAAALYFPATQLSARNICGVCVCVFVCMCV